MIESDTTELKRELNDKLEKEVVAFLNTKGGDIFIGIDNEGEIIGVEDADQSPLGCYLRIGSGVKQMEPKMIDRLFASRTRNSLRNIPSPRFGEHTFAQSGTGMGRILSAYDRSIFHISKNFIEISFPFKEDYSEIIATPPVTPPVTDMESGMSFSLKQ